jgi:hypothetical protein
LAIFALMALVVLFALFVLFAWITPAAVQIRKRALSFSRTTTHDRARLLRNEKTQRVIFSF